MSSREPLWYCHQCNAEMRPLMVPDPVCASCHGSFVEKMEDPSDDPREFQRIAPFGDEGIPPGLDTFLLNLQTLMERSRNNGRPTSPLRRSELSPGVASLSISGPGGSTLTFGRTTSTSGDTVPTMSDYLRGGSNPTERRGGITGPLMAQYLMALLGRDPFGELFLPGMSGENAAERGRMGDYVFNQEALDQIITQIMESSNAHRPVPATDEIMDKLPREVLEITSPMLEKDCAVCKEQFSTETEDPDEQIVVTLPCQHPFHQPCILPWLKSSGTCPVCRHALIPQPDHHDPGSSPPGPSGSRPSSPRPSPSRTPGSGGAEQGGLLQSLFGYMGGGGSPGGSGAGGSGASRGNRSGSLNSRHSSSDRHNIPGRFPGDELD